jgi:hypothetical protein
MREYDNIEYRYKTGDANCERALKFASSTLGFAPDTARLKFDLSFFSGGIGVLDKLAFSCFVGPEQWEPLIGRLNLVAPHAAMNDAGWREDFAWLVKHTESGSVEESCCAFINAEKKGFQGTCTPGDGIFFFKGSDVNSWTAVWGSGGEVNYLYFDQG